MPLELHTCEDYAGDDAALEARARRAAKRVGLRAIKSRWRRGSADNHGKFMLVDPGTNTVTSGARFELEPAVVIAICEKRRPV
jgi:hypothetical protein